MEWQLILICYIICNQHMQSYHVMPLKNILTFTAVTIIDIDYFHWIANGEQEYSKTAQLSSQPYEIYSTEEGHNKSTQKEEGQFWYQIKEKSGSLPNLEINLVYVIAQELAELKQYGFE